MRNNYKDKHLKLWAFIQASTYRQRVMKYLYKAYFGTPTQIALNSQLRTNHISKVLRELKEKGLIICINEGSRKGRVYKLTKIGNELMENFEI